MILRLIVLSVVIYLAYRLLRYLLLPGHQKGREEVIYRQTSREDLVEDPFCHTYVPEGDAFRASIDGRTVYFCSEKCYKQYREQRKARAGQEAN